MNIVSDINGNVNHIISHRLTRKDMSPVQYDMNDHYIKHLS